MHLPTSFCKTGALPLQFLSSWAPAVCMPVQQRDGRDIVTTCVSTTSNQITRDTKSHNLSRIILCWGTAVSRVNALKVFCWWSINSLTRGCSTIPLCVAGGRPLGTELQPLLCCRPPALHQSWCPCFLLYWALPCSAAPKGSCRAEQRLFAWEIDK